MEEPGSLVQGTRGPGVGTVPPLGGPCPPETRSASRGVWLHTIFWGIRHIAADGMRVRALARDRVGGMAPGDT